MKRKGVGSSSSGLDSVSLAHKSTGDLRQATKKSWNCSFLRHSLVENELTTKNPFLIGLTKWQGSERFRTENGGSDREESTHLRTVCNESIEWISWCFVGIVFAMKESVGPLKCDESEYKL